MDRSDTLALLTAVGQPYELVECEVLGRRVRVFRNAPRNLRALYESAQSHRTFVVYGDERLTFREFWSATQAFAEILRADYGVARADRVAISLRNYPEWMIAFAAVTSIGAIAVAMNALWMADELRHALGDCDPKVLVLDQERLVRLPADGVSGGCAVLVVRAEGGLPPWASPFPSLDRDGDVVRFEPPPIDSDDDAVMLYTSGSTGRAKGVLSTHRNLLTTLMSWELDAEVTALRCGAAPEAGDGPHPVGLLGIPLFHVTGLHSVFLGSFRAQRRLVSMYKWDPGVGASLIAKEGVTTFTAPSAVTGDLVAYASRNALDLPSLQRLGGGGAARAPEQVRMIDAVFPRATPHTAWGMTETNAIGMSLSGSDYLARPESSGQVAAVLDIRIVRPDGEPVPPGAPGELQVRGSTIMRGYWRRPDANAEAFQDGWLRTGDVARIDAAGFIYIIDRIKDLVIRGGENIGCGAVEAALLEHPGVLEASVYGVPDDRLGEEVAATLYVTPGVEPDEVRAFLEDRLARHERPQHLHLVHAELPRHASGKIAKQQLRSEALARLGLAPRA